MAQTHKATQKYIAERRDRPVDPLVSDHDLPPLHEGTEPGSYSNSTAVGIRYHSAFIRHISGGYNSARREANMRQWLKVREVAAVLAPVGMTEAGVRDLLRSRDLHGNQPTQDGWWRVPLVSLQQYLTTNDTYLPEQIDAIMAEATALLQRDSTDTSDNPADRAS